MGPSSYNLLAHESLPASAAAAAVAVAAHCGADGSTDEGHVCDVRAWAAGGAGANPHLTGSNIKPKPQQNCSAAQAKTRESSIVSLQQCATPQRQHSRVRAADGTCGSIPFQPTDISNMGSGSAFDLLLNTPSVTSLSLRRESWPEIPLLTGGGAGTTFVSAGADASAVPAAAYGSVPASGGEATFAGTGIAPRCFALTAADVARLAVVGGKAAGAAAAGDDSAAAGADGLLLETGGSAATAGTVTLRGMAALSHSLNGVMSPTAAAAARGSYGSAGGGSATYVSFASFALVGLQQQPSAAAGAGAGAEQRAAGVTAAAEAAPAPASQDLCCGYIDQAVGAASGGPSGPQSAASATSSASPLRPQTPSPHYHAHPQQQPSPSSPPVVSGAAASQPSAAVTEAGSGHAAEPLLLAVQAAQLLQRCNDPELPLADGQLQPSPPSPPPPGLTVRAIAEIEAALAQQRRRAVQQQRRAPGRVDSNGILICGGGQQQQQQRLQQHRAPGRVDSNGILICGGGGSGGPAAVGFFATQSSRASSVMSGDATPRLSHQAASATAASTGGSNFVYHRRRGQGQEVGYSAAPPEAAAAPPDADSFTMDPPQPAPPQQLQQLRVMDSPFQTAAAVAAPAPAALANPGSGSASSPRSATTLRQRQPGSGASAGLHRRFAVQGQQPPAADAQQSLPSPLPQQQQQHAGGERFADARCRISDSSSQASAGSSVGAAAATAAAAAAAAGDGGGRLLAGRGAHIAEALAALRQRAASDAAGDSSAAAAAVMAAVAAVAASTDGSNGGGMEGLRRHMLAQGLMARVDSSSLQQQLSTGLGISLGRWADADGVSESGANGTQHLCKRACELGYDADAMAPPPPLRDGGASAAAALASALVAALGQQGRQQQSQQGLRCSDAGGALLCGPGAVAAKQALLAPPPAAPQPPTFRAASLCASSILDGPLAAGFTALIEQLLAVMPDGAAQPYGGYCIGGGDGSTHGGGAAAAPAAAWAALPEAAATAAAPAAVSAASGGQGSRSIGVNGCSKSGACPGQHNRSVLGRLLGGCFGRSSINAE